MTFLFKPLQIHVAMNRKYVFLRNIRPCFPKILCVERIAEQFFWVSQEFYQGMIES